MDENVTDDGEMAIDGGGNNEMEVGEGVLREMVIRRRKNKGK